MRQKILTLKEAYEEGRRVLRTAGIGEADLDAWYLLEHVSGIGRSMYYARPEMKFDEDQAAVYLEYINRRAQRIPLQHITGTQEFMGLTFRVNEHVLIPRQDTETLVECGLEILQSGMRVLDLCTGSGCIIISLLKMGSKSGKLLDADQSAGVDISEEALEVARENARIHQASELRMIRSDLFAEVEGVFDLIISNPPYIRTAVIEGLQEEVKCHDPYIALDGKEDGLYFYRKIIKESVYHLADGGWLLFETGYDQKEEVSRLMDDAGFTRVCSRKDLSGLDRVVMGMYNEA